MRFIPDIVIVVFAYLVSTSAMASGLIDGFRSFRWGSEPTSSMFKTDKNANMQGYQAQDEDKTVLGFQADFISYYYYGGGLCRVEISWWPQPVGKLNQLQSSLEKHWGKPAKLDLGTGTRNMEWISSSGITSGHFLAMDDTKNTSQWFITIIVQGRECSKSAIESKGL